MHNENFYDVLKQRQLLLMDKIQFLERYISQMPEVRLKACTGRKGKKRFYYRVSNKVEYKYLSSKQTLNKVMNIYYARKALPNLKSELSNIEKILQTSAENANLDILDRIERDKKVKISPTVNQLCDAEYIKKWLSDTYEQKPFDPFMQQIYSTSGKQVRSKSEGSIINCLESRNVPFYYEYPIYIDGITFHPDFRILRVRDRKVIYWEHWGAMDNPIYVKEQLRKLEEYRKVGIELGKNLFITMECNGHPLNTKDIFNFIDKYLV